MKKQITVEDVEQLTDAELDALRTVCLKFGFGKHLNPKFPNWFITDYLSVGQMIELLGENWWRSVHRLNPQFLCDDLWKAVKERLNEDVE